MQIIKEYKLYTHPRRSHNKRDCLLVHEDFMYIHDNMMDAVRSVYKDYLNDSDNPIINYIITVVYEDGGHMTKVGGVIKPRGDTPFLPRDSIYNFKVFNHIVDGVNNYVL